MYHLELKPNLSRNSKICIYVFSLWHSIWEGKNENHTLVLFEHKYVPNFREFWGFFNNDLTIIGWHSTIFIFLPPICQKKYVCRYFFVNSKTYSITIIHFVYIFKKDIYMQYFKSKSMYMYTSFLYNTWYLPY